MSITRIIMKILFVFATICGICWCFFDPDWEPALTSLTLLATIIGLFTDKWLNERELRKTLLKSFKRELLIHSSIIGDIEKKGEVQNMTPIPHFEITILNQIIYSNLFLSKSDNNLKELLYHYQILILDVNTRLRVQEIATYSQHTSQIFEAYNKALFNSKFKTELIDTIKKIYNIIKVEIKDKEKKNK